MLFQTPATIESVRTLSDGTIKLSVETQELTPDNTAKLFGLTRKLGWFVFQENEIKMEDLEIPEVAVEFKTDKTPSQRLRNVLYKLWEQSPIATRGDFDTFYKVRMEKLIEQIKLKLD